MIESGGPARPVRRISVAGIGRPPWSRLGPCRGGGLSAAANPSRLYEHRALGRPVGATPVADTDGFGGLVRVGQTAGEVTDLLREALAAPPADSDRRIAFARRNSWEGRAAKVVEFLGALKHRAG